MLLYGRQYIASSLALERTVSTRIQQQLLSAQQLLSLVLAPHYAIAVHAILPQMSPGAPHCDYFTRTNTTGGEPAVVA